jgi:hypothetical protein
MLLNHPRLVAGNEWASEPIPIGILATAMLTRTCVSVDKPDLAAVREAFGSRDDCCVSAEISADYVEFVLRLLVVLDDAELVRMRLGQFIRAHTFNASI